jgi:intracellular sulfur oxidation DsrE/DsrF family protein
MLETDNTPDLFLKHPTSVFLNSAIYFRYNFRAKAVTVMVFGTYLVEVKIRLLQVFPKKSPAPMQGKNDPFVVLSAIMAECSSRMEYGRRKLDFSVRDQESKTGATAYFCDESLRAQASEYGDLVRTLHVVEALVMFFQRTLEYQVGLLKFLEEQHRQFQMLSLSYGENVERNPPTLRVGDSLRQSLSLTTHRLEQVKTLDRRIQIQIRVVDLPFCLRNVMKLTLPQVQNLISQNDSRVNILVAAQGANIAMDTRKDSIAMKTIAGITVVFLPGTFVAVSCPMIRPMLACKD